MAARNTVPSGVIDHLIRLPIDNTDARLRKGLIISASVNVVVLALAFTASQLRDVERGIVKTIPVEIVGDDLTKIRIPVKVPKPQPEKVVKREVERPRKPTVRKERPVVRPKPVQVAKAKPEPVKPKPVERAKPVAVAERNPTSVRRQPAPNAPTPVNNSAESARVATNTSVTASVNTNRALSPNANASANVSVANPSLNRAAPSAGGNNLALSNNTVSSSAAESASGATVASRPASAPAAVGRNTPEPSVRSASAGVAGIRGGYTSFGGASSGMGTNVATISAPTFVGRRRPALGSTVLIPEKTAVMTAAISAKGEENGGLGSGQAAVGTVPTSIAVGRTSASIAGSGAASMGKGGRGIGTTDDARAAGVSQVSGVGNGRGPALGNTTVAALGRGAVGSAADGDGNGTGVASAGNNLGAAVAGSTRSAGGGSGPTGQIGTARAGGGGGSSVAAGAGSTGPISVDSKTAATSEEIRRPSAPDASKLGERNNAGGSQANRNDDPKPTFQPDVDLPTELRKRRFEGRVLLEVTVDVDGNHTERILLGSGDEDVDNVVRSTFRRWKWEAGYRDGKRVRATRKFEYRIRIND